MTYTVLVAGGRKFGDLNGNRAHPDWAMREKEYRFVLDTMETAAKRLNWPRTEPDEYGNWLYNVKIVTGGATGVDSVAITWAVINWCQFIEYPARWQDFDERPCRIVKRKGGGYYNALAGFNRNQRMIDSERINYALLFPGGKGTADMKWRIINAGIPYEEFKYDPSSLQDNQAGQEGAPRG